MPTLCSVLLILVVATAAGAAPGMLARDWGAAIPLREVVVIASEATKAEALALRVIANRLDHGEAIPELDELFAVPA